MFSIQLGNCAFETDFYRICDTDANTPPLPFARNNCEMRNVFGIFVGKPFRKQTLESRIMQKIELIRILYLRIRAVVNTVIKLRIVQKLAIFDQLTD
jgi:hypothetical protein